MKIRLFTSQPNNTDYIELNVLGENLGEQNEHLVEIIRALYVHTDIDEIGIESMAGKWKGYKWLAL